MIQRTMISFTSMIRPIQYHLAPYANLFLRLAVVIALLVVSVALGLKGTTKHAQLIILLSAGIIASLTLLKWPPLGLVLAFVAGVFFPDIHRSGLNLALAIIGLLLFLWIVDMVVLKKEIRLVSSATLWPAIFFIIIATISFGFGQLPWYSFVLPASLEAQFGGYLIFILSMGTFLLVANQIQDLIWLKWMVFVFLIVCYLYVLGTQVPGLGMTFRGYFQRIGSVAWIWMVALSLGQALFNKELRLHWRVFFAVATIFILYVAFILRFADKSGWVPALVTAFVIVGIRSWRVAVVAGIVAVLFFFFQSSQIMETEEYSLTTRIDAWLIMAEIVKANPVFGLGFSNYYWFTPLFPIRGWEVQFNSHNNYIDIVAQTGLLGLACYMWFFGQVSLLNLRLLSRVPDGFPKAYVYAAFGGIAGMLVTGMLGDWVLPFVYNIGLSGFRGSLPGWLFLGGLVFLENKYRYQRTIGE
jgi:O-antigen ligase